MRLTSRGTGPSGYRPAISHAGWNFLAKMFRYIFHFAPLRMQITVPNWRNRTAPLCADLPGKHAIRLSVTHPQSISGVCTSGCAQVAGLDMSFSICFSYRSSLSIHRQCSVRASSGALPISPDSCIIKFLTVCLERHANSGIRKDYVLVKLHSIMRKPIRTH